MNLLSETCRKINSEESIQKKSIESIIQIKKFIILLKTKQAKTLQKNVAFK